MQIIGRTTAEERVMLGEVLKLYREYEALFVGVISDGISCGGFSRRHDRSCRLRDHGNDDLE